MRVGDTIAAGACYGKIRAMMDDRGRRVKEAGPSMPVEILGLNDVPNAGEVFVATESEKEARSVAETFISEGKNKLIEDTKAKLSLDAVSYTHLDVYKRQLPGQEDKKCGMPCLTAGKWLSGACKKDRECYTYNKAGNSI